MAEKKKKEDPKDAKLKEQEDKINELTDMLKRVQAEFINYRQRAEKENRQTIEYSNAELLRKLLPALDSFEMALKNCSDHDRFVKGVEMVYAQLFDILKQEGLKLVDADGEFDPYKHEVLLKQKSGKPEDTILEVLQKGYQFKERIIRHAKVKISG
ncbi:nucleotide exchange factor GrpE [Candidatus Woesearchaeota archaeon]|nr:nucleotide exchange factor GrpE [Candidatus Woesearchaeota archaeon]